MIWYTFTMTEEILDIVDDNDNVIDTLPRSEVYAKDTHNIRVINCFIRNSKGELWIPRRVATKKLFPLCLDMSCGETYEEAFTKEMREELSIDTSITLWKEIGTFNPKEHGVGAFMKVYEVQQDTVPEFNPEDYFEYLWLTPTALLEKLKNGEATKSDLPKLVKLLYM